MSDRHAWQRVCRWQDILPESGVCARVGERQIAVFRAGEHVFALDNLDPCSGANVLARGIVGELRGELVVASPIYKQHFSLRSGRCLESPRHSVRAYPARVLDGSVWVRARRRLVVVGNGIAGLRVVEELLAIAPQAYDVVVFGAEPHWGYDRSLLSPVLAGETEAEAIELHPRSWYVEHGITLHAGDPVVAIDRGRRTVRSANGVTVGYDRLLLATGSHPVRLDIPGAQLPGVVSFRNLGDLGAMLDAIRPQGRAVVVGGGVLGVEAAAGLRLRGMSVTLVHRHAQLMDRHLDEEAGRLLAASLRARGIDLRLEATVDAVLGATAACGVRTSQDESLAAELVVTAIGIRPNADLARSAGLRCERGILVDDTMQSFDPAIYAVGECIQHRNTTFGMVAPLWEQGRVCAVHLAEVGVSRYVERVRPVQLKVSGLEVFSVGRIAAAQGREVLTLRDARRGVYKRLVLEQDRLVGALLVGDVQDAPWYLDLLQVGRPVTDLRSTLIFGPGATPAAAGAR